MRSLVALMLLVACVPSDCAPGPAEEGDLCRFEPDADLDEPVIIACAEGLFCDSGGSGRCMVADDVPSCAFDTDCGADEECRGGRCLPNGRLVCTTTADCAGGEVCNGTLDPAIDVARCGAPSEENGPCLWDPFELGASEGCADGLVCRPETNRVSSMANPEFLACRDTAGCRGLVGECMPAGNLTGSAACIADEACESGRCSISPPPLGVTDAFELDGSPRFPWPGVCLNAERAALGEPCSEMIRCGPHLVCLEDECRAANQAAEGERCDGTIPEGQGHLVCQLGLTCDSTSDLCVP